VIPNELCGLSDITQKQLILLFKKFPKIKKVILYGSRAKGNFKTGSDIDLTVDAPDMTLSELLEIENDLDDLLLPYKIDLSLLHHIDNPALLEHIERIGKIFYNPNPSVIS
jgi:predicted nucleotidyltransferase